MNIEINVNEDKVLVKLMESGKIVIEVGFDGKNSLSEKLLPSIDEVLRQGSLKLNDVDDIIFQADVSESYTSYRIIKTVVDSLNWAKACSLES